MQVRFPTAAFPALLVVALLGSARAQVIDTVTPAQGGPGTEIVIDGSGLLGAGGVGTPKVFLRHPDTLKKTPLKVLAASATQITALFTKGLPGLRDVVVVPKASPEIVEEDAFEVMLPVFTAVDSGAIPADHATPGQAVTANGQFFGTLKGSLRIGNKKTKVSTWTDTAIAFLMPAKLEDGFYSLQIKNKIGISVASFAIIVTGGVPLPHKPDAISAKIDNVKFQLGNVFGLPLIFTAFDPSPDPPDPEVPTVTVDATAITVAGQPSRSLLLRIPFDIELDAAQPLFAGDPDGVLQYTETVGVVDFTIWASTDLDYEIVVYSFTGDQFVGIFSGTLQRTVGDDDDLEKVVTKGKFRGTLPPPP